MFKITIECDDPDMLGQMFQDAIVQCHLSKMREMTQEAHKRGEARGNADLHQIMLDFYDKKVAAYEKMRDTIAWKPNYTKKDVDL